MTFDTMDQVQVHEINNRVYNECVFIEAEMEDMLTLAADEKFCARGGCRSVFLGIIVVRILLNTIRVTFRIK